MHAVRGMRHLSPSSHLVVVGLATWLVAVAGPWANAMWRR
jgi:hypothetical protein